MENVKSALIIPEVIWSKSNTVWYESGLSKCSVKKRGAKLKIFAPFEFGLH